MDRLEEIFKMQSDLDAYIRQKRALTNEKNFSREEWVQKKCLALLDETSELLNEVNYKWWKNPKEPDRGAIAEELVDMLHFWVSMCLDMDLSAEQVFEVYKRKNEENRARQDGKSQKTGYAQEETR